jgi:thiamine biosynthesis lipoprotein
MGTLATLHIHHHDRNAAEHLVERSLAEVRRLEAVFSLHREDSALAVLNRQGALAAPPPDLVALLTECRRYWELTGGAFDPTVQALWRLYQDHFTKPGADPRGPSEAALQGAMERVGFGRVAFDANRIVLPRRGAGLTLNGIAQGYVTDRVADLLREGGIRSTLVDMGEPRAVGSRPTGEPWRVGIADPDRPGQVGDTLEAVDRAVATSGAYGFHFDQEGRFNHLLDPRTGAPSRLYRSVTAVMPRATSADALSTAFSFLPTEEIAGALRSVGGEIRIIDAEGGKHVLTD